ncbi:hypothetical protein OG558_02730 [Kribbella sp. NBC_01510]|uniref:hypothetical protein n=1 Tax=Kribbella sp. NBC_01510 TaxID=2903581 RepID=UPI00386F12F6
MSDQSPAARPGFRERRSAAKAAKRDRKSRWKAEKLGAKSAKAAFANARAGVRRMSRAERGAVGRAGLTRAHLAEMATQHVAGHFNGTARTVGLSYEGTARQLLADAGGPDRILQWNPAKMVRNAASRWADVRRGTKELKAGYAMARNAVDRMEPTDLQTIGAQRMTPARLQYLAEQGMRRVVTGGPSTLAPEFQQQAYEQLGAQQPGTQQAAPIGQQQTQQVPTPQEALLRDRIQQLEVEVEALRNQVAQLQAQQAQLEQQLQVAQQLQPEVAQQQPEAAEAQTGAAQQQPEGAPERAEGAPERAEGAQRQPEVVQPRAGAQQQPEMTEGQHDVGIHQVVETQRPAARQEGDPENAQHWVDAAAGQTPGQPAAAAAEAVGQRPDGQQTAPGGAARNSGNLSVRDMQEVHAAFAGRPPAEPSSPAGARDTAVAAEKGLHKTSQDIERKGDSINR